MAPISELWCGPRGRPEVRGYAINETTKIVAALSDQHLLRKLSAAPTFLGSARNSVSEHAARESSWCASSIMRLSLDSTSVRFIICFFQPFFMEEVQKGFEIGSAGQDALLVCLAEFTVLGKYAVAADGL